MKFLNRTALITGASRGIGKAIALKLASEGANIIVAAKSTEENPKLGGTIFSAAKEIEAAGGKAFAIKCDIRDEEEIKEAVRQGAERFGGIDILVNNASAISLTPVVQTETKRFDLMHDVNVRGTFLVSRECIPHLQKGTNPHILTLSPPVNLNRKWFGMHLAYTLSKYNMTMIATGLAEELKQFGIASNALWPQTTIATAAVQNLLGGDVLINMSRKADIMADAAAYIFSQPSASFTGQSLIDEKVLEMAGITDLGKYAVNPGQPLYKDLFLD